MEKYALTGGDKRSKKYTDMKKEIKKIEEEIKELLLPYSEKRANEITKLEEEIKKLNKVKDADKIKELNDKIAILQAEKQGRRGRERIIGNTVKTVGSFVKSVKMVWFQTVKLENP